MTELEKRYDNEFSRRCVKMEVIFYGGEWIEREVYVKLRCIEHMDTNT